MLAVARGQDQDPPSNSIILALWRGPGSPLSAAACSPKCKANVSLLSASLPSLATLRGPCFLSCHFPTLCHNLYCEVSLWSPASANFPWWPEWLLQPRAILHCPTFFICALCPGLTQSLRWLLPHSCSQS